MINHIHLKINTLLPPYKIGDVAKIRCDADGVPFDHYWRNRLKDAVVDQCVTIVNENGDEAIVKSKVKKTEELK